MSPGVRVGSPRVFRYQHVGVGNAKLSHWLREFSLFFFLLSFFIQAYKSN